MHSIYLPITAGLQKIETVVVKGALDGVGTVSMAFARLFARAQTGEVQQYVGVSFVVVAVVVLILMGGR